MDRMSVFLTADNDAGHVQAVNLRRQAGSSEGGAQVRHIIAIRKAARASAVHSAIQGGQRAHFRS